MSIEYTDSLEYLTPEQLQGFFVGWPHPPSPAAHLKILQRSDVVELAIDTETDKVAGFTTGLADGVITLYISYLEVLPEYQGRGIGSELTRRLLHRFEHIYGVNLNCNEDIQPFYAWFGMERALGMVIRRYEYQSGK